MTHENNNPGSPQASNDKSAASPTKKIVIANNAQYELCISVEKNRVYLKIKGYWRTPEVVPHYVEDWDEALRLLRKNFTVLTDAAAMKTHPPSVRELHERVQRAIMTAGVRRIAEIVDDEISTMQLDSIAKATSFPKKNFRILEDAEAWLDASA